MPEPVDVFGGLPDHSANPAAWKYVVLTLIFVAWAAFLVICGVAGSP